MVLLLLPVKSETSTHFIVGIPSIYEVTSTGIGRLTGRSFCLDRYSRIRLLSMSFPHGILDCLTIKVEIHLPCVAMAERADFQVE
jgi:hypothetical protein